MPAHPRNVRRGRSKLRIALLLGSLLLFALVVAGTVEMLRFRTRRAQLIGPPIAVVWPTSLGALAAAEHAHELGVTDSPLRLALLFQFVDAPACFVPGAHLLPKGASPGELIAMLCRSPARPFVKVTVVEGFHRFAIAERLEKLGVVGRAAFLRASEDRALLTSLGLADAGDVSAEGFLFPATYDLHQDSEPGDVVRRLVAEFDARFRALTAAREAVPLGAGGRRMTRREVVTLASIIEKEAVMADERTLIASVFFNRLRDPSWRRLESDPTAIYGCFAMPEKIPACKNFDGRASPAINRDSANAYSTYVHDGLPPGPIANPGEASLASALEPAATEYRFFVSKGGGRHTFSVRYEDHLAAVRRLRDARRP